MRRHFFVILLLILGAFIASCGNNDGDIPDEPEEAMPEETAEPPKELFPDYGGTLVLTMRSPATLNPLLNEDVTVDKVLSLLFEKLYIMDEAQMPVPNPLLVQSAVVSADAKSLTLTMAGNLFWSDGTQVTASDVAYSIEFLRDNAPSGAVYKSNITNIQNISVAGDVVRINLKEPNAYIGYLLGIPIIPQAYYKGAATGHSKQMNPLGNGTYVFDSYLRGRELRLKASPLPPRGRPYIEDILVEITGSVEQDINAVSNGAADALYVTELGWNRISNRTAAKAHGFISRHFEFIGFNFSNPLLSNREARAAVAHAVPYRQILESVYMGEGVLSPTPISPGSWLNDEQVTHPQYDLERASAYLDVLKAYEHTYQVLNETAVRILANEENLERVRSAELLHVNLVSLGIASELVVVPWDEYTALISSGGYDIFFGAYNLSQYPDISFMFAAGNKLNYSDSNLNLFLNEARTAVSDESMRSAYSNIQNFIAYEIPVIGLLFRTSALLVSGRVYGDMAEAGTFPNIEQWYINHR